VQGVTLEDLSFIKSYYLYIDRCKAAHYTRETWRRELTCFGERQRRQAGGESWREFGVPTGFSRLGRSGNTNKVKKSGPKAGKDDFGKGKLIIIKHECFETLRGKEDNGWKEGPVVEVSHGTRKR